MIASIQTYVPTGRVVVEVGGGVTVYPAREPGDRWRAVWYEGGRRRQCESVSEAGLAVRLAKVTERLTADAPGLEQPGAELIALAGGGGGVDRGLLSNVRWQPGDRPAPPPRTSVAGESQLYVDQADIPATADVTNLACALSYLSGDYELMAYAAAYTGLR